MEFKLLDSLDKQAGMKQAGGFFSIGPDKPQFTEHDYEKIAREGYKRNPFVYSALNFSGDVFADVELKLFQTQGQETVEIEDHPALNLLANPNEDQGGASFKKQVFIFLRLAGKQFTHVLSPDTGRNSGVPQRLMNWVPSDVEQIETENMNITGFKTKYRKEPYPKEEVIFIREFHPTNLFDGHPAAMSASRVVDVSNKQLDWNYSILENRGVPAHIFKGGWTQEQAKKWRRQNERELSGPFKAGRDLYMPDSVDIKRLGFDTQELDWLEGMKEMKRVIYSIFNVPSELMNDGENKTYSNVEQAIKSMIYHNTLPAWRLVLDAWNAQLLPKFGDNLYFEVDMDSIASLQESMMEKLDKGIKAYEGNLTTLGESRKMADLDDDVPNKDRRILRSNFIPEEFNSEDADEQTEEELNMNGNE